LEDFKQILTRYWGYPEFRPLQEDIIRSVYEGKDTLGLLPTGGGKSITFQVPALAREGICLVITPLIALMKDQVNNLNKRGIKALAIHSGLSREEIDIALDNCIYGDFKFLYLSPERIGTELFRERVQSMKVNLIAIDESHCISQWGYDFRPSYLKIADIRDLVPDVPFLALTATATPRVVSDIMDKLHFGERNYFQKSFERKNLTYRVDHVEDKMRRLLKYCSSIKGTGIVYVRNRKKTREIADILKSHKIAADYYHAGLSYELRSSKQEAWQKNKIRIIVSTNAFGMGIDKPDVRLVAHYDLPDSPEAYFQEAGRAGRDEKPALAVLLYSGADRKQAEKRIETNFPEIITIKEVYHALGNFLQIPVGAGKGQSYDFILSDFLKEFKFSALVAHSALKILQREGYIELSDEINNPSRVHFRIERDDLYKFQVSNARFDGFIKLLLRSYSGFFSSYVAIDENLLARRSGLKIEDIFTYLKLLQKYKIIDYIPRKRNPVITYTEERLESKGLYFSVESYQFLKERYKEKLEAMISYAGTDNRCRSIILLEYFGEKDAARCGKCDVCAKKNELQLSNYEFDLIKEDIKTQLMERSLLIPELASIIEHQDEKFMKVFRWLLDHGKIQRDDLQRYKWAKKA
jgi:ATP-dependent DNA helicase RecQ